MDAMYAGMFDEAQAVAVGLADPADSCGGGQGSAWELPISGTAAPTSPADVIKKSLRVDMFPSPNKSSIGVQAAAMPFITLYRREYALTMSQTNDTIRVQPEIGGQQNWVVRRKCSVATVTPVTVQRRGLQP